MKTTRVALRGARCVLLLYTPTNDPNHKTDTKNTRSLLLAAGWAGAGSPAFHTKWVSERGRERRTKVKLPHRRWLDHTQADTFIAKKCAVCARFLTSRGGSMAFQGRTSHFSAPPSQLRLRFRDMAVSGFWPWLFRRRSGVCCPNEQNIAHASSQKQSLRELSAPRVSSGRFLSLLFLHQRHDPDASFPTLERSRPCE